LENYNKAIEINPALADGYFDIACIYSLKKDNAKALEFWKKLSS